jgi:hypothetical protein
MSTYNSREDLKEFSRIIKTMRLCDEIGYKYGLKLGAFARYYYQQNVPSIQQLWKVARSLSELENIKAEYIYLELSIALENVKDKR